MMNRFGLRLFRPQRLIWLSFVSAALGGLAAQSGRAPAADPPAAIPAAPSVNPPAPPAAAAYKGKLVFLRAALTPAYGQGGEKKYPLPAGTVLQVRDERIVEGTIYLQTLGGVLRAQDVLLLDAAVEELTASIAAAERAKQPTAPLYHLRGLVFHKRGEFPRAIDDFTQAIIQADSPGEETHLARAESRIEAGLLTDAAADADDALAKNAKSAAAHATRGWVFYEEGKYDEATKSLDRAAELDPKLDTVYLIRGWVRDAQGDGAAAKADFEQVLKLNPLSASARNSLAWLQATSRDAKLYDPAAALVHAKAACEWDAYRSYQFLDTLAAAHAANGDFAAAVKTQTAALKICHARDLAELQARLALYEKKTPYRAQK